MDYNGFYDRKKMTRKEVHDIQYLACMNPTAGSFTIDPRLQAHFATFAVVFPSKDECNAIYCSILKGHLASFEDNVRELAEVIVKASVELHAQVVETYLPTATKFHYQVRTIPSPSSSLSLFALN